MATSYSKINNSFLNKISDYSFLNLTDVQIDEILKMYMTGAIVKFNNCKQDLTDRDDTLGQFNIDLEEMEIEIIATLMIVEWLTPQINTGELIKQKLGLKEYTLYSQANHLKEVLTLRNEMKEESDQLIIDYSYDLIGLEELK